jgi:hypothetical protein
MVINPFINGLFFAKQEIQDDACTQEIINQYLREAKMIVI